MNMFQDRQEQKSIKNQILDFFFLKKFRPPSWAYFSKDLLIELSDYFQKAKMTNFCRML